MKKILVITNIYPMPDPSYIGTNVVHYFTKEWVKMGYEVKVVHIKSYFPHFFYLLGRMFKNFIKAKTGSVVHTKRLTKAEKYSIENVRVLMIPVFKLLPHARFTENRIRKAVDIIIDDNCKDGVKPDVAVGHFRNPQLQILHYLKESYININTCMVMHSSGAKFKKTYPENYEKYLESLDLIGFRSKAFKTEFDKIFNIKKRNFLCYSGIPTRYLNFREREFEKGIHKYCFVGNLFKLKRVENTIVALNDAYPNKNFVFNVVGDGAEITKLKKLTKKLKLEENIIFHGRLTRDDAQNIISNSDIYVMVSISEAFGLSYVEALAKGCITIGTKGQGIDGVIVHGKNGFLCKADDNVELSNLFKYIQNLDATSLKKISCSAFETAKEMTEFNAAKTYINALLNI